jgi:triacylglycerol lipase
MRGRGQPVRVLAAGLLAAAILSWTLAAGSTSTAAAVGASSRPDYPVPYTFLAGILAAPSGPDTPPPGANIWTCKPSRAHPYPVVLVHGLLANETDNWQTFAPLLADNGYCVFSLTYGTDSQFTSPPLDEFGGLQSMVKSAHRLATFVDKVLRVTGAPKVDILGHSEGATMPDYYIKFLGGAAKVARFVGLAPVVHGTNVADAAMVDQIGSVYGLSSSQEQELDSVCASCAQFSPTSPFIEKLDRGGVAVPGVAYTQIMTRYDELVVPYTSGEIDAPNSTNIVVQNQCPLDFSDHIALAADPVAAQDVLNALDPSHPRPVPCTFVPPVAG